MDRGITVRLNFFGPTLKKKEIDKIMDKKENGLYYQKKREILKYFFGLPFDALSKEVLTRYAEVTMNDIHDSIMPSQEDIFKRLLTPLKSAKKSYCLGEYTATVALCGIVGEMLAILVWKMNEIKVKGNPVTEKQEKGLFGFKFEELNQKARLKILKTLGCITQTQFSNFEKIRKARRPYMHFWNVNFSKDKEKTRYIYKTTFRLYKKITGLKIINGRKLVLNPLLSKYLSKQNN